MARNLRSDIIAFLRYLQKRSPATLHWDPKGSRADGTPATVLHLEDHLPGPPFRSRKSSYSVTSKGERLMSRDFGPAAGSINRVTDKGHGRTLTCVDNDDQPVAAISYHYEAGDEALLVLDFAPLVAASATEAERHLSEAMTGVLLGYLAAAAKVGGLPARLALDPKGAQRKLAERLGFKSGGAPKAYAYTGKRYMTWTAPVKL